MNFYIKCYIALIFFIIPYRYFWKACWCQQNFVFLTPSYNCLKYHFIDSSLVAVGFRMELFSQDIIWFLIICVKSRQVRPPKIRIWIFVGFVDSICDWDNSQFLDCSSYFWIIIGLVIFWFIPAKLTSVESIDG